MFGENETQVEVKQDDPEDKRLDQSTTLSPHPRGRIKQQRKKKITQRKLMKSHKLMRGKLQRRGVSAFSLAFSLHRGREKMASVKTSHFQRTAGFTRCSDGTAGTRRGGASGRWQPD